MPRYRLAAPLAALSLIAAVPAGAAKNQEEQNSSMAQSSSAKSAKAERKICRTYENTVSRMRGKRLCLTAAQWKEFQATQED